MKRKISFVFVLLLVFSLASGALESNIAYANNNNNNNNTNNSNLLEDAFNEVSSGSGQGANKSVIGPETKETVNGLSQDAIDIVSTIAMTMLICACVWTATRLSTVGENANKKLAIKTAILLQVLGIVYLANVISFISFSFGNLQIF